VNTEPVLSQIITREDWADIAMVCGPHGRSIQDMIATPEDWADIAWCVELTADRNKA